VRAAEGTAAAGKGYSALYLVSVVDSALI